MRDHIFISYASEQSALCDWLARRLTAEGYAVWCDRQKLLGGENWPQNIDDAIAKRTFRMLALFSRESMNKPNPQGEWQKGLAIGKKLGIIDFVIPIKTNDLKPEEIQWNWQNIQYISFTYSWANGFFALLQRLESINAPRHLVNGKKLAIESMAVENIIKKEKEMLLSNCFEVIQVPKLIREYTSSFRSLRNKIYDIRNNWACHVFLPNRVVSFYKPSSKIDSIYKLNLTKEFSWKENNERDIVVNLIHKCIHRLLSNKGMLYCQERKQWYMPSGVLHDDCIKFVYPDGRASRLKVSGQRTYGYGDRSELYKYYLSPSFSVLPHQSDPFIIVLQNRVYITDEFGFPLNKAKIISRRKHLCQTWFNKEWCARTLGIAHMLSNGNENIRFGPRGNQQLVISAKPATLYASQSINDESIRSSLDMIYPAQYENDRGEYA